MERVTAFVGTNHPMPEPERITFENGAHGLSHDIQTCREDEMRAWAHDTPLPLLIRDSYGNKLGEAVALQIERLEDGCTALVAEMELTRAWSGRVALAYASSRGRGKQGTWLKPIVVDELIDRAPHVLSWPAPGGWRRVGHLRIVGSCRRSDE